MGYGLNEISIDNPLPVNAEDIGLSVARGQVDGASWVLKSGRNSVVGTATVPEDIWNGGGAYAGFPLTAPEIVQVFSSSASDTGVLTLLYLPTATSTAYVSGTVTLNGTTPVDCSFSAYRVHSASYNNGSATTGNVGEITVRWKVTTAVVFCKMPIGTNQTYAAGYTIPLNPTGYLYEVFCSLQGSATASVDGALWIRMNGMSFRLRRNFTAATSAAHTENLQGRLTLPALTDIQIRITVCSANNTSVVGGYSILLIEN